MKSITLVRKILKINQFLEIMWKINNWHLSFDLQFTVFECDTYYCFYICKRFIFYQAEQYIRVNFLYAGRKEA